MNWIVVANSIAHDTLAHARIRGEKLFFFSFGIVNDWFEWNGIIIYTQSQSGNKFRKKKRRKKLPCIRFKWVNRNYTRSTKYYNKRGREAAVEESLTSWVKYGVAATERRAKGILLCVVFGCGRVTRSAWNANFTVCHTVYRWSITRNWSD